MENLLPVGVKSTPMKRGVQHDHNLATSLFFIVVALTFTAALSGVVYQFVAVSRERARYPAPGRLVDIGGYRLHIHCLGHGFPAVILDAVWEIASTLGAKCNRR